MVWGVWASPFDRANRHGPHKLALMPSTYITTPIYYVNDRPHIGHCYTTLLADCLARFERLRAGTGQGASSSPHATHDAPRAVFFLTGTDEHADKVVTSAAAHGMTAIQWADRNADEFRKAFAFINASNDDFIRTTQDRHKSRVAAYMTALLEAGDIYKGSYEGWYDDNQEEYLTDTVAKEQDFKSATTGRPLVRRKEECYFFRLSKYQQRLEELFAGNPGFVQPDARRNEVLGRFRDGLQDIAASRPVTSDPATQFGIRVPGDEGHRIYVWIDALFNYLSVVDTDDRRHFWPPRVHFIAKDILWFHAIVWPAMLMALQESGGRFGFVGLPKTVYSHAYWVRDGKKMSKSLGNFVTIEVLQAYAAKYSLDALRWYLLTQGPLHATDADFSHAKFVEVYNADLANGIGNCASRVANMVEKYFGGKVPAAGTTGTAGVDFAGDALARVRDAASSADRLDLIAMLRAGKQLVDRIDAVIAETKPFTLAKDPANMDKVGHILFQCAEAVRIASILLSPAMPEKMAQLWRAWNIAHGSGAGTPAALEELCAFGGPHGLKPGHAITKGEGLFMRADPAETPPA